MADRSSKTQQATSKKRADSRRDGQVARSPELAGWVALPIGLLLLPALARHAAGSIEALLSQGLVIMGHPTQAGDLTLLEDALTTAFDVALPLVGVIAIVTIVATIAQVGFAISTKAVMPKMSRLNPIAGAKRFVSPTGLWELAKSILKLVVIAGVAYAPMHALAYSSFGLSLPELITNTSSSVIGLVRTMGIAALILAIADYFVQRRHHKQGIMMSHQEVRDESRQSDGDPKMRGAIRGRQLRMSRSRMMAAVAQANTVVVNPTHYAVALRYDRSVDAAPRVLAKGAGVIAQSIRTQAERHHIPIVEDPPLARAIYAVCEIDAEVPPTLYAAVARLLAFVYALTPTARTMLAVHRPSSLL